MKLPAGPLRTSPAQREVCAVVGTAALHLVTWSWPVLHAVAVAGVMAGWLIWILRRWKQGPDQRRALGLQRRGLAGTLWLSVPLATATLLVLVGAGWWRGTLQLPWTLAILLVTYPLWGLTQQLLVQGVLVRHLDGVPALSARPWLIALLAGLLFGAVHWPFTDLMVATSLMGAAFALIWLRHRNLWPLGLLHGWLGAAFFLWWMGKDPAALTLAGLAG